MREVKGGRDGDDRSIDSAIEIKKNARESPLDKQRHAVGEREGEMSLCVCVWTHIQNPEGVNEREKGRERERTSERAREKS